MWLWAAADQSTDQDGQTAIILGVIGLLTAVLVAVASGIFSLLSARANRTSPAHPTSIDGPDTLGHLRERVAVLERRADDSDDERDLIDRRVNRIEDRLDLDE